MVKTQHRELLNLHTLVLHFPVKIAEGSIKSCCLERSLCFSSFPCENGTFEPKIDEALVENPFIEARATLL